MNYMHLHTAAPAFTTLAVQGHPGSQYVPSAGHSLSSAFPMPHSPYGLSPTGGCSIPTPYTPYGAFEWHPRGPFVPSGGYPSSAFPMTYNPYGQSSESSRPFQTPYAPRGSSSAVSCASNA